MSDQKLIKTVEEYSKSKPVAIYMKGTPEFPMCGFSARACEVLKAAGVKREDIAAFDVLSDDPMWGALEEFTKWPTVPQIFIKGEFIGGGDILMEMFQKGELQQMLSE